MSSPIPGDIVPESPLQEKMAATKSPVPPEIFTKSGERYRILRRYTQSSYIGLNITHEDNGEDENAYKDSKGSGVVAIHLEPVTAAHPRLQVTTEAYNSMAGLPGIPFVHCTGTVGAYHYAVMDLLGPTLEDLFAFCDRNFSLKTILVLADQLLCRMESLHSESRVYPHFGPDSVAMGLGKFGNVSHLIGDCSDHIPDECSDADAPSRDDLFRANLFDLGLVLVYFARSQFSLELLRAMPVEEICHGLPVEFLIYFNLVYNWRFDEESCYDRLRLVFRKLFVHLGFMEDYVFDWTVVKYQKNAEVEAKQAKAAEETAEQAKACYPSFQSILGELFRHMRFCKDSLIARAARRSQKEAGKAIGNKENLMTSTDIDLQNPWSLAFQPQMRSISQDQLVAEVLGIYTGLRMVDDKCVEIDAAQNNATNLNGRECLAVLRLHATHLREDHDLFIASLHPTAGPSLRNVALDRKMSTRMFRIGIQPCLNILQANASGSRSNHLSFLRLSYSMVALLYETVPELRTTWVEFLYILAQAFKDADPKNAAAWDRRIQLWQSQRVPAAADILQLDVSNALPPDVFAPSNTKPCSIENGTELLLEKAALAQHYGLSVPQFTKNSPCQRPYSPLATFRDMVIFTAAFLISSSYIFRHEAQVITWGVSEPHAPTLHPIYSSLIPDFPFAYFISSCLVFVCALASLHRRSRHDRYQTRILILVGITGAVISYGFGISVDLAIFGVVPSTISLGMILSIIGHLVGRKYRERTGRAELENGNCIV